MGPLTVLLIGVAGWMIMTGRLRRLTARDGVMIGVAILGAVMAAKGKVLPGGLAMLASAAYLSWRKRAPRRGMPPPPSAATAAASYQHAAAVAEARALLGVAPHADADAVRAAHRRLIASVHPDRGGTQALAAQINAARDLLLRDADSRKG